MKADGDHAMDQDGIGMSEERIARNIALHIAVADGNFAECETLLNGDDEDEFNGADAWWEDENHLRWNALHFAVHNGHANIVKLLLKRGGIWNAIDELGFTPADYAWSLNDEEIYQILFEEGVRQTLVLNLLDRKALAQSASRDPNTYEENNNTKDQDNKNNLLIDENGKSSTVKLQVTESSAEVSAQNDRFLLSRLNFVKDEEGKMRCVDQDGGLVMAAWETDVMEKTARLLCTDQQTGKPREGLKILNVGFGLGIVDEFFQRYKPGKHVIVEAHPDAIDFARKNGWHERPGVELIHAKWEEALDRLSNEEGLFDVIYWDTYAQGYGELRDFFEEVPYLLNESIPSARFSFFHGLAGTNRFLYDVYTRVSELDLRETGLDTHWYDIRPNTTSETWNGILRKYWDLDVLRIPISTKIVKDE